MMTLPTQFVKEDLGLAVDEPAAKPDKPFCCFIVDGQTEHCSKTAEWSVVFGSTPDDYTEACTDHVGVLLEPGRENVVYPLRWAPSVDEPQAQQVSTVVTAVTDVVRDVLEVLD